MIYRDALSTYNFHQKDFSIDLSDTSIVLSSGYLGDVNGNSLTDFTPTIGLKQNSDIVIDVVSPVITLIGDATVTLEVGATYTEEGATANDNYDTSLTVVVGGDTVDTSTVGTYTVTYNVSDAAGNAATEVTRTVNVEAALSIKEIDEIISVYPNPVKDYMLVNSSEKTITEIFDIRGLMIKRTSEQKINVSELHSGIYIVKINTQSGKSFIKKLIKE